MLYTQDYILYTIYCRPFGPLYSLIEQLGAASRSFKSTKRIPTSEVTPKLDISSTDFVTKDPKYHIHICIYIPTYLYMYLSICK